MLRVCVHVRVSTLFWIWPTCCLFGFAFLFGLRDGRLGCGAYPGGEVERSVYVFHKISLRVLH